jgi:hypothetical protein
LNQLGQIIHETISQKITSQKRAGGVAQGVGPEFNPRATHTNIINKSRNTFRLYVA